MFLIFMIIKILVEKFKDKTNSNLHFTDFHLIFENSLY